MGIEPSIPSRFLTLNKMGFYYNQPQGFYYNQQPKQGFYYNQQPKGFYYNQQQGFYYNQQQQTDSIMTVSTMMDFITISHKRDSTTIKDSIMTSKTLTTPSSTRKTRTTGTKAQDANEPLKR